MSQAPFLAPERDRAFKFGRPKGNSVTYYTVPGNVLGAAPTSGSPNAGNAFDVYAPFYVQTPVIIDQLAAEIVTLVAAKNFRMGFYAADTDWQPVGAPLADSGDISTATTGVKTYTPGTPIYVPRGRYLSVMNHNDNTGTAVWRMWKMNLPVVGTAFPATLSTAMLDAAWVSRAYAGFPTPGTPWNAVETTSNTGWLHYILYRISQP